MFFAEDKVTLAGKLLVRFDAYIYKQVALGTVGYGLTVLAQADGSAIVHASRDFKGNVLILGLCTPAMADGADLFWYLAGALAGGANAGLLDIAKHGARNAHHLA